MGREKYDVGTVTFETTEAIPLGSLVKLDTAGTVTIADVTQEAIGTAAEIGIAAGQRIGVDLHNKPGFHIGIAAAAITKGAVIYGRDDGEIDDSSADSALRVGRAVEAAAAGDLIQFIFDRG
mgnify:CR=1 FL=1